jgi:D-serine deaminase-like pyridoxal phosphate-dependent protein
LEFSSADQEHGILSVKPGNHLDLQKLLPVGTRLRILPNHACATAAQFPEYQAYSEAGEMNVWPRFYGW